MLPSKPQKQCGILISQSETSASTMIVSLSEVMGYFSISALNVLPNVLQTQMVSNEC